MHYWKERTLWNQTLFAPQKDLPVPFPDYNPREVHNILTFIYLFYFEKNSNKLVHLAIKMLEDCEKS